MSKVVKRWYFDPKNPYEHQEWQIKVGDEWQKETGRDTPTLNKESLLELWIKVLVQDQYEGKRSVSTIAKHFDSSIRNIKTQRAYINTEYRKLTGNPNAILLHDLADFTPHEQAKIDRANKVQSVQDLYDNLPPELKKLADAYRANH